MRRAACFRLPALLAVALLAAPRVAAQTPLDEFPFEKDPRKSAVKREGSGVRMATPAKSPDVPAARLPRIWDIESPFGMRGDFEISANYDVTQFGVNGEAYFGEGNAEITTSRWSIPGFLGINVGARPGRGDCFNILRIESNARGTHYNIITLPRKSKQGRIGMQRKGAEMIFMVADGPNEPFEEVIRYPCSPTDTPRMRLSAFQGQAKDPMPVDVLFDKFEIKAERFLRGTEIQNFPQAELAVPAFPMKIDYGSDAAKMLSDFGKANDGSNSFRLVGNAIRVKAPVEAVYRKEASAHHYRSNNFALAGDLECSFKYEVKQFGPIGKDGYGSVALGLSLETGGPLGSFQISRGMERNEGHRYSLTRYSPSTAGGKFDTQSVKTTAMSGEMTIRRIGAEAVVLVKEGDAPPKELWRFPIAPGTIKGIRLLADQGGSITNALEADVTGMTFQAMRIGDPAKIDSVKPESVQAAAVPQVLEGAPRTASRKWVYLGGGAGLFLVLLLLTLILSKRRAGHQA